MKLIYVCSPYRGNPPYRTMTRNKNLRKAAEHCRHVTDEGHIPIAPHLFFSAVLKEDDPTQRENGIRIGLELLEKCDEVRVFGDEISEGMKREIQLAEIWGKPIFYKKGE